MEFKTYSRVQKSCILSGIGSAKLNQSNEKSSSSKKKKDPQANPRSSPNRGPVDSKISVLMP